MYLVDPAFGCVLWMGPKDKDGYGITYVDGRPRRAHRVAYERALGAIPDGHEVEHLCRRRNCVNPEHLEPIKRGDNERSKRWKHRVKRTHCKRGHEYPLNAMVTPEGGVVCRACKRGDAT